MCSICGGNYPLAEIKRASGTMIHRGPDFSGDYEDSYIALAHNRLKILDLKTASNQPFTSPFCPHLVLVFNGEIYNYLEIKEELKKQGIPFVTQSDTEVLLHSFAHLGERCLQKFNGDFAFVIYDKRDKSLFLARDRLGNKPLFYALEKDKILFASEIKAFLKLKDYPLNLEEVSKWLLFGNGDLNKSIYEGIYSFPAAHYGIFKEGKLQIKKYWNLEIKPAKYALSESLEELQSLLLNALKIRLRADVPLALLVSGGIDSSLLAHLAVKLGGDVRLFGVSFKGLEGDESRFIRQLQRDLNQEISLITPDIEEIKRDFKALVYTQDEIFRSFSLYPQFLLFRVIADSCKVALGGQGADELFGGYYHHIGRFLYHSPKEFENRIRIYGNEAFREYNFGLKCALRDTLKMKLFREDNKQNIKKLQRLDLPIPPLETLLERFLPDFNQGLLADTFVFNLPHLLRYEDRNAMAHSVENRTPFTDFRVVEFAFSLQDSLKFQKGFSKYLLRLLLESLGSKSLAWRKDKIGFGVPEKKFMDILGFAYQSLFDVRVAIFEALRSGR
ncbi:asparagine synthase (glutamine-hydrolyzing) [Helicobacter mesocricetorum]|uniref:asparagine synthase (glutamine-hydrolyzing) n=1 Tax=Helicobacter mesocricetorum TaxID=87012 RepID=UPI000CF18AE5|nr:asparagine synthase (glutamine-hydrolyzing) [Helicobacter mesocricetorum]